VHDDPRPSKRPAKTAPDILIVDDTEANLRVLSDVLRDDGYLTRPALSGELALLAVEMQTPDLVLLDVMMPGMDGIEVCRRMKEMPQMADIPIVFLSALDETDGKVEAFAAGGVDYVTKPFQIDEVRARVKTQLKVRELQRERVAYASMLESLVRDQVQEIEDSQMATIFALARLAESRDGETGNHLHRVQSFCELLARGLAETGEVDGIDGAFVRNIVLASLLHDIGKVAIGDEILLKPGKLSHGEFEVMKCHTTLGSDTLEAVRDEYPRNEFIAMGIDVVRWHHERWDGTGYPDGLAGDAIPLAARIMAVADVYDALRSERVYKSAVGHEDAARVIVEGSGSHFDPRIVGVFRALEAEFDRVVREAVEQPAD